MFILWSGGFDAVALSIVAYDGVVANRQKSMARGSNEKSDMDGFVE